MCVLEDLNCFTFGHLIILELLQTNPLRYWRHLISPSFVSLSQSQTSRPRSDQHPGQRADEGRLACVQQSSHQEEAQGGGAKIGRSGFAGGAAGGCCQPVQLGKPRTLLDGFRQTPEHRCDPRPLCGSSRICPRPPKKRTLLLTGPRLGGGGGGGQRVQG